ncbi:MAG TPA: hypothetical protein DIT07_15755, partial [Sphingobacteriaceae bacterium]|nr:hypothetical protein [Sphingobacteriaceae bacterium]
GLSYYKKADMSKTAVAVITAKNKDGKFVPAKNARVNFYVIHDKEQALLKSVNTDNKGLAVIELQKSLPLGEDLSFTIVAKIENDKLYEDAEEQVHYKDANLTLNLNPHDTTHLVTAKVTEIGKDGKEISVKGAELKFYVQRLFGMMPAAEENTISTDEKGEASFAFPKNIPGDSAGVITVAARMEDNELFGNVENKATTSWGTALAIEKDPFPRALWEPYAPLPLVIILAMIFGGVWCTYFFIFFQLRKIKKEGQQIINNSTL